MLPAVTDDLKRERFGLCLGICFGGAIDQYAGQRGGLGNPSAVYLYFIFNRHHVVSTGFSEW
jgi:hypothetical protein